MNTRKPTRTIDQVFEEFLADQEARLSERTFRQYESIIGLYGSYLESYWPDCDENEYRRITGTGGTYCGTLGPDGITGGISEFLGYFMPRKVAAGKDTMRAAGTVTKKLMRWLAEKGYVEDEEALEGAEERAGEAIRDLPASHDVADLLDAYIDEHIPARYSRRIEDHFIISRIEPGKLWLEPLISGDRKIGPVPVPHEVSQQCQLGWDIGGIVAKTANGWRFLEVWNVTP